MVLGRITFGKRRVTYGPVYRNRVSDCTGGCLGGWRSVCLFAVDGKVA